MKSDCCFCRKEPTRCPEKVLGKGLCNIIMAGRDSMKSNLQKEKRKKYVRLKKNFGWRILCAVGIIFSAVSLLTGCRMEQWEADISEKTEKSIRVSKPMQASLDVVAAGETLSLLRDRKAFVR